MLYWQTRIEIEPNRQTRKMQHMFWQPETQCKPWAIHAEGYDKGKMDVTIYHEDICESGKACYKADCSTADKFLSFVSSQLRLWDSFKSVNLEYRTSDALALYRWYSTWGKGQASL